MGRVWENYIYISIGSCRNESSTPKRNISSLVAGVGIADRLDFAITVCVEVCIGYSAEEQDEKVSIARKNHYRYWTTYPLAAARTKKMAEIFIMNVCLVCREEKIVIKVGNDDESSFLCARQKDLS